ncbi:ceramide synthase 4-like isoform X2 [Vombatus ursinus]|uniref:ceramide synthase 4-like isoform X2 n=1 Tax=Vombatus ursinus TaxID=29139 RepID=UPI000FFDBF40|nr:ceramide synthase 4-like isoform X2 [Vombatus ursinus]
MLASLYNWFWKAEHWIPPGLSWTDLEDSDGITYPHSKDLWMALPLTVVLILVRYLFERTIGLSLSRAMGVCDKLRVKAAPNPILESFFWTESQNPKEDDLSHLAHQCGLSLRKVQRWFRHKRKQEQPLLNKKFCESSWRFLFYFFSSIGGFFVLYKEPWFWEPRLCWEKYPKQPLQPALYWWFLLEIVFYLSLLLTMFSDVKRKDFKEQIIHHLVAITLLYFSYSANFLRIGALVMLLHDVSDVLLEILHIFWFSLISRMLFKFILARGVQNDIRSDVEELDTSDDQSEKGKQKNEKFQTNDIPDACTFPQARGVRQSGSWRLARHVPTT